MYSLPRVPMVAGRASRSIPTSTPPELDRPPRHRCAHRGHRPFHGPAGMLVWEYILSGEVRSLEVNPSAQQWGEFIGGGGVVEGLSGSGVEALGDGVEVGLGELGQGGAFGEVLAQQPIGVLVRAALPGAVRVGEVDGQAGGGGDLFVAGQLHATVP